MFYRYNLPMRLPALPAALMMIVLSACTVGSQLSVPSPRPTDTQLPQTTPSPNAVPLSTHSSSPTFGTASATVEATSTSTSESTETETPLPPTTTPTLTLPTLPEPTPTVQATDVLQPAVDSGALQFLGPGPLSELISPFYIFGYAVPGYNSTGTVTLYGEDGRVLDSQLLALYTAYKWAYFAWPISFKVQGAAEFGRLTMSTNDEYGRLTAVYSVHLILLPEGNSVITPPGDMKERCVLDQPDQGIWLSGGTIHVTGKMRPFNTLPLVLQLIDPDDKVIALQSVLVPPAPDDGYVPFQVNMAYTISRAEWVRLTVSQADDRISGLMYLYSREIYLHP